MRRRDRYYRPSHRFRPSAIPWVLMLGAVLGGVAGFIYAYLIFYNPFVFVSVLATVAFGVVLAVVAAGGNAGGHVRSPVVGGILGAMVGLLGLYASWVTWSHAILSDAGAGAWLFSPEDLRAFMWLVSLEGVWSIRDIPTTGGLLYFIWGVEALIIIAIPAVAGWLQGLDPFCEKCKYWTKVEGAKDRVTGASGARDSIRSELEEGDISVLADFGPPDMVEFGRMAAGITRITISSCPKCKETAFLQVEELTMGVDKKGSPRRVSDTYIKNLILPPDMRAAARALPDLGQAAAGDAEAPPPQ